MIAVNYGRLDLIKIFFDKNLVNVNEKCFEGKTALYYAIDS